MNDELDTSSGWRWFFLRLRRHWRWAREQGISRVVEEDELNPLRRVPRSIAKWRWRRAHSVRPKAVPVFLVGVQRSGTNMVVRGLEASPEFEVHNENDRRAFSRFRLRSNDEIRKLVERSAHRFVLFKPLCDSHRTNELLDELGTPSEGRAIWAYRGVDGRVRSALAKFGSNNLVVLREIAARRGDHLWQAQGLSEESLALIRSHDYETINAESAAALFWYVRNALFFELGLDRRADVLPVSYEALVADPEPVMRALCRFLGFPYDPALVAHIGAREAPFRRPMAIDADIRRRCEELQARLDAAALARVAAFAESA